MNLYPIYCDCSGKKKAFTHAPQGAKGLCPKCKTWRKPDTTEKPKKQ